MKSQQRQPNESSLSLVMESSCALCALFNQKVSRWRHERLSADNSTAIHWAGGRRRARDAKAMAQLVALRRRRRRILSFEVSARGFVVVVCDRYSTGRCFVELIKSNATKKEERIFAETRTDQRNFIEDSDYRFDQIFSVVGAATNCCVRWQRESCRNLPVPGLS